MYKVIRIGTIPSYNGRQISVYCKIEYTNKKLSISGVIGPTRNGNAIGCCGQIDMEFEHKNPDHNDSRYDNLIKPSDITFAEGWNAEKLYQFLEYWKLYHLNDMQPACEHQRAAKWGKKKITLYTYKRKTELYTEIEEIKNKNLELLKQGKEVKLNTHEIELLNLPYELTGPKDVIEGKGIKQYYELEKKESKTTGWVYEKDHPEGVLSKPCPVCKYEYGSSWLHLDVPENVIAWLFALPETDKQPAWV